MSDGCPKCGSSRSIQGRGIYDSDTDIPGFFVPQVQWWKLIRSYEVPFKTPLRACVDCGLVWSVVDADELCNLISKAGASKTKQELGLE